MLWIQRKRRRKIVFELVLDEYELLEGCKVKNEDWIKFYFSCFFEEKLVICNNIVNVSSSVIVFQFKDSGEVSITIRVEIFIIR